MLLSPAADVAPRCLVC